MTVISEPKIAILVPVKSLSIANTMGELDRGRVRRLGIR